MRDVGEVPIGAALEARRGRRTTATPAVILGMQKQPGANTLELTRRLDAALDDIQATLPAGMEIDKAHLPPGRLHRGAIETCRALRDGALLVVVIVLLFLANVRAALITLVAIPLSLVAAVFGLKRARRHDQHDDPRRHGDRHRRAGRRRHHRRRERLPAPARERAGCPRRSGARRSRSSIEASVEIRSSIVFATRRSSCSCSCPLFFLAGVEGRLLQPLGLAFVIVAVPRSSWP